MFGAGTACIVCPVERIVYQGKSYNLATMDKGLFSLYFFLYFFLIEIILLGAPLTNRFHDELVDIQFGRKPSKWSVPID